MVKDKVIKQSLAKVKTGVMVGSKDRKLNSLIIQFGCGACSFRDTPMCPHGLSYPQKHSNGICTQRVQYVKEVFAIAKGNTRYMQVEEATRLKLLLDKLTQDYTNEGIIDPNLSKLSKNIISLLDKMRRQDEGLKIQGEMTVVHEDFRKLVDIEAEKIEKQNNGPGQGELTEKIPDSGQ